MDPQPANWKGRLDYALLSDIGLRRTNNQDSLMAMIAGSPAVWQQRGDLLMVADGMGAHAAGELASKLATDTIPLVYSKLMDRSPPEAALAAVEEANTRIHDRGQASLDFKGMGTTCTTLLLLPQGAVLAHVGDSRAYRLRANRLEQLTFDHSLVWEMRAAGRIQGPVPDYIPKNVITRSLGPNPAVQVDLEGPYRIAPGDVFLLCSDGLSGPVKDDELGMILNCLPPADAAQTLIDLANLRGGPDNITVIAARAVGPLWTAGPDPDSPRPQRPARPVPPLVWIMTGVSALAGLGLLAMGQPLPAVAALLATVLLGGGALIYRQGGGGDGFPIRGRFGRGPYSATDCTPNPDFVARLAAILEDLRQAANQDDLGIDWAHFNALAEHAAAASRSGDCPQAVRDYSVAISFMMAELKRQGKGKAR
jgi:protein phosphatase